MIFNHTGVNHPWMKDMPSADWYNHPDGKTLTNFRLTTAHDPYVSDYDKDKTVNGWFVPSMPDLNQRNPEVMKYLIQNSIWWIENSKIDGIRMDTYPYADMRGMSQWGADVLREYPNFNIVGECWYSNEAGSAFWQKDSQLKLIHNALEKKIKNELHAMLNNDRAKYEEFWKEFGRQIKFGAYSDYGMHAELLRDLLLFWSAKEQKMVTLQEYVDKMPAEQKFIYFAAGDSTDRLAKLPAAELVLDKGYDVLLLTEDVDEFCLQIMRSYPRKDAEGKDGTVEFKNVNSGDLGLETEDEKKAAEDATAENKPLFDAMKDALDGKVKEVKVSTRLKDHPVCLSADGPLSIEMEKVLSKQPGSEGVKSDKVLELNINHPVFAVLKAAQEAGDTDKVKKYSSLLYAQAQLIEGLPVDDPAAYAEAVCSLMK